MVRKFILIIFFLLFFVKFINFGIFFGIWYVCKLYLEWWVVLINSYISFLGFVKVLYGWRFRDLLYT